MLNFRLCKTCKRYVSKENAHCEACNKCTTTVTMLNAFSDCIFVFSLVQHSDIVICASVVSSHTMNTVRSVSAAIFRIVASHRLLKLLFVVDSC